MKIWFIKSVSILFLIVSGVSCTISQISENTATKTPAIPSFSYEVAGPVCNQPRDGNLEKIYEDPELHLQLISNLQELDTSIIKWASPLSGKSDFRLDTFNFEQKLLLIIEWGAHSNCGPHIYVKDVKGVTNNIDIILEKVFPDPKTSQLPAISSSFIFLIIPRNTFDPTKFNTFTLIDQGNVVLTKTIQLK